LTAFLEALDVLLAAHGEVLRERSVVTVTRRPGLFSLSEADIDAGSRPVLIIGADVRDPGSFGQRLRDDR
jgi:hypothetical protein